MKNGIYEMLEKYLTHRKLIKIRSSSNYLTFSSPISNNLDKRINGKFGRTVRGEIKTKN